MATLEEVTAVFYERTGISAHIATVRKGLREAGIQRERAPIVQSKLADERPARMAISLAIGIRCPNSVIQAV